MALRSGREPEVDDIAVLNDVLLAFEADLAVIPACRHRPTSDQRIVCDHFCPDEPSLDVRMNFAGRDLGTGAARDGPGAAFILPHCEEGHVSKQVVARPD